MPAPDHIPRRIWQTYKTAQLPAQAAQCRDTWLRLNPGCVYDFLDDAGIDAYMERHCDEATLTVFRSLPLGVMRADMWRYVVMYVHGGVYADIDAVCVQPIEAWLGAHPGAAAVVGMENDTHMCNWAFAAAPGHPLFRTAVERIVRLAWAEGGVDTRFEHFVHKHTGPGIWTEAVSDVLTGGDATLNARPLWERFGHDTGKAGIVLQPYAFFNGGVVRNLYGSVRFGDGYVQWVSQRDAMEKKLFPLRSRAERPAGSPKPLLSVVVVYDTSATSKAGTGSEGESAAAAGS